MSQRRLSASHKFNLIYMGIERVDSENDIFILCKMIPIRSMGGATICFKLIPGTVAIVHAVQKNLAQYCDLIVRMAGYSDYFCDLGKALHDEIIARTEHQSF